MARIESISIELTRKCNHRCYYCYANNILGNGDIDYNFLEKFINDLRKNKINCQLQLKGGEPMLSKIETLELIKNSGFPYEVYTNLNFKMNDYKLEFLKNANCIMASYHYLNSEELFFENAYKLKDFTDFEINVVVEPKFFLDTFKIFLKYKDDYNFIFTRVVWPEIKREFLLRKFEKEYKVIQEYYLDRPELSKTFIETCLTDSRENTGKPILCDQFQFLLTIDKKIKYGCGYKIFDFLDYEEFMNGKYFKKVCCSVNCICPSNEEFNGY